ncbi:hypothetical protein ACHAXR_010883, partial [Thalassiosira sp. AJA248-18]
VAAAASSSRPTTAQHRPGAAAAPLHGIPSAIGGPASASSPPTRYPHHHHHHHHPTVSNHYELRLPPSDEQAVLQRVPRTHATVVAHDLPPPPTSSDAWSSTSGGSSARSRKRTSAGSGGVNNATGSSAMVAGKPMVASVRLANGGMVDSVNMNDGSPSSSSSSSDSAPSLGEHHHHQQNASSAGVAMHVTMDDPILRKKISLKHEQMPSSLKKPSSLDSKKPSSIERNAGPASGNALKPLGSGMVANTNGAGTKRKMTAVSRANTSDDSSDGAKSETEAVGSGSDEGYAASSERQSGSGSDSISSDDAKKDNVASSARGGAGGPAGQSKSKVGGVTMASQSNSKRHETSSMTSSVLADFSSVMNSLSRSESPRSSCTSLSSNGGNDGDAGGGAKAEAAQSNQDAGGKRDSTHLNASSSNARKRSKSEMGGDGNNKMPTAKSGGVGMATNTMMSGLSIMEKTLQQKVRLANHHHYHSRSTGRKMLEKSFLSAKRDLSTAEDAAFASTIVKQGVQFREGKSTGDHPMKQDASFQDASIYSLGQDVMAQVMAFLEPPEIHSFLTTPFSQTWLVTYTAPQELWKILCTSKPFYAKLDDPSSDDASNCSFPICNDLEMRHLFGRYRLLYTSFVRCMKYLNRLQDDALNGRTPSVYSNSNQNDIYPYSKNTSLKAYFAKARRLVRSNRRNGGSRSSSDAALSITSESGSHGSGEKALGKFAAAGTSTLANAQKNNPSSQRFGRSMLTDRLLRPTQAGDVDNVNLPWSCAIYSVVNWMVAFADVEGIQIMCLKCLPYLLEDESQRTTAQRAGLTDSVLRAMVLFPDSIQLHTVAFHTLVLLARPLGGNEGMLFHTAMVNTRGIFNNGSSNSKNGIVIMLDSMRRFAQDEILQAMSCWSLVNVALTPLQKSMLVKLGGLTVTSNAMLQHPYNAEVQFRALFALINLVIPTETRPDETEEMREFEREIFQQLGEVGETSEKEMLDASVGQISNLVVVSMKNFCSSEAILNRACLVLHNLSLNEEYHSILLWTPNCYQMLEWCLGNYPHDHVLQQSAGGTIQRLNATLSADEELRTRFTHSIRAQQQHSLELARQEAVLLQEQQREQEQQQMDVS